MNTTVLIDALRDGPELTEQFQRSLAALGLDRDFLAARAIFIKPNLTYPLFKPGVTTRVEYITALIEALRTLNDSTWIYVGEGESGSRSFAMTEALERMGFRNIERKFPRVRVVNLSDGPRLRFEAGSCSAAGQIELPRLLCEEIDFAISCPVPKLHCLTTVSLALKNVWGCLPDAYRLRHHSVLDNVIAQLAARMRFRYAFLDGAWGLDGNGPIEGTARRLDWFAASNSLGAFDRVLAARMGFDASQVAHLASAERLGLLPALDEIRMIEAARMKPRQFRLRRTFWNYPALAAFYSRRLTELVYLSRFSKAIHRAMYLVRRRAVAPQSVRELAAE